MAKLKKQLESAKKENKSLKERLASLEKEKKERFEKDYRALEEIKKRGGRIPF